MPCQVSLELLSARTYKIGWTALHYAAHNGHVAGLEQEHQLVGSRWILLYIQIILDIVLNVRKMRTAGWSLFELFAVRPSAVGCSCQLLARQLSFLADVRHQFHSFPPPAFTDEACLRMFEVNLFSTKTEPSCLFAPIMCNFIVVPAIPYSNLDVGGTGSEQVLPSGL